MPWFNKKIDYDESMEPKEKIRPTTSPFYELMEKNQRRCSSNERSSTSTVMMILAVGRPPLVT